MKRNRQSCLWVLLMWAVFSTLPARALILFNLDNTANQSDPGTGVPWQAVGKVTNAAGTAVSGSVVYLGNGYALTANHVTVGGALTHVTFDGTTTYALDMAFFGGLPSTQVAANVDLKIVKLAADPGLAPVNLLTTPVETTGPATAIGWGVGRDATPLGSASVGWGGDATSAKRWGVNRPVNLQDIAYQSGNYTAIRTIAGGNDGAGGVYNPDGLGDSEAALTLYDSGSGLFQNISGTWYLIGIGTTVDTPWTSLYGDDLYGSGGSGDGNYYVRISSYDAQILSIIPEPGTPVLVGLGLGVLVALRRRRAAG